MPVRAGDTSPPTAAVHYLRPSGSSRLGGLSITHIVDLQGGPEGDVIQSREASPHDAVARRRIRGAGEIAAEPGGLCEIERERPGGGRFGGWIGDQAIEDVRLQLDHNQARFEGRLDPVEHRQPEHAPAQDAEHGKEPGAIAPLAVVILRKARRARPGLRRPARAWRELRCGGSSYPPPGRARPPPPPCVLLR